MTAVTFAVVLQVLLGAHQLGDYWVQTDRQARVKVLPGWRGRRACAAHVATYTATTALAVAGVCWWLHLPVTLLGFVLGQAVSAVTHYVADRRTLIARLADATRSGVFYRLGQPRRVDLVDRQSGNGAELELMDLRTGMAVGYDNPVLGTGAAALDQAWHWVWLAVAAGITAGVR